MNNTSDFKIIVIDDNPSIHYDFIKILKTSEAEGLSTLSNKIFGDQIKDKKTVLPNFQIDTASQGQEGVELIKKAIKHGSPYSLAFVDIRMPPGWDGIETIEHIWKLDKDIQVVICTAYSDYTWEETVARLGKTDNLLILKKPFDNVSVRQLACALTKKWQLSQEVRKYTSSLKKEVANKTTSLQQSLSLVKATLESSDEGIIVINKNGAINEFNHKFINMWNIPESELKNSDVQKLLVMMSKQLLNPEVFLEYLQKPTDEIFTIEKIAFKDGKYFDCYAQPQEISGKIVGRVLNFRDITERTNLEKDLQHQATHDALTNLPNRVFLFERIQNAITQYEINKNSFAVLFLDLDRFKLINDSLSHAVGDNLLRQAASRLRSALIEEDTIARLGGDEFVILLKSGIDKNDIMKKAQELIDLFHTPFSISNRDITVTLSIGIAVYPDDGKTMDELLRNADAAMYYTKEFGADNFKLYSSDMHDKSVAKLDQEMELRQAIANNELFLCYQPQFDLSNEKLVAVEALVRWQHPTKGILLPIDFIPLAEETGLIVPIGEWVLRTACIQNKKWQEAGLAKIRMAVNITAQQLKQQNIVETVRKILSETGLAPEYLELELTENVVVSSVSIINTVTALKELGISIAIDDFGTGYSSLSYLKNLPLDRLKIDSAFIQHIQSATDDEIIIRAIIAVAKNLNLEVLAEGVETKNQLDFLKKQQCNEIQGFYYSQPLSDKEMKTLLNDPKQKNKILDIEKR